MKIFKLFVAALMLCAMAGCNADTPKIGVVNLYKAVNESNPGKAANAELNRLIKTKQDELKAKENTVAELKKSVQAASSSAAKKSVQAQLAKADEDYRQFLSASNVEVKKKAEQLRIQVLEKLQKVIDAMGREENFKLILTTTSTVYFEKTIDVTDQVIKKFNQSSGEKEKS